ncbi:MAG: hypothetical protein ABSF33_02920 [Acidimicrobiales bacterium]
MATSTVALVGPAGASTTTDAHSVSKAVKHRELARLLASDCVTAHKWLHHQSRIEARFAKRLHRLRVWEAEARADGHKSRLAALEYHVTHVLALRARDLSARSSSREWRLARAVSPACAVLVRMIRVDQKAGRTEARAKARAARAARVAHIEAVAAAKAAAAKAAAAKAASTTTTPSTKTTPPTTTPSTTAPSTTAPSTTTPPTTPPTASTTTTSTTKS